MMNNIQTTPVSNVSFQSQAATTPISPEIKQEEQREDQTAKVAATLTCLAMTAAGVLLAIKGKNKAKVADVTQEAAEQIKKNQSDIADVAKEAGQKISNEVSANLKTNSAIENVVVERATYHTAREAASKNQTHDVKKMVNEKLSEFNSEIKEFELAQEADFKKAFNDTKVSSGELKNINQQLNTADFNGLENLKEKAIESIEVADSSVKKMETIYAQNSTKTNKNHLKQAQSELNQAYKDAEAIQIKANNKQIEIVQDENQKLQNKLEAMEHSTPEARLEGQVKMESNAQKTQANKAKRQQKDMLKDPRFNREYAKMEHYSKGKLENIINTSKNNFEKAAAQYKLGLMA